MAMAWRGYICSRDCLHAPLARASSSTFHYHRNCYCCGPSLCPLNLRDVKLGEDEAEPEPEDGAIIPFPRNRLAMQQQPRRLHRAATSIRTAAAARCWPVRCLKRCRRTRVRRFNGITTGCLSGGSSVGISALSLSLTVSGISLRGPSRASNLGEQIGFGNLRVVWVMRLAASCLVNSEPQDWISHEERHDEGADKRVRAAKVQGEREREREWN